MASLTNNGIGALWTLCSTIQCIYIMASLVVAVVYDWECLGWLGSPCHCTSETGGVYGSRVRRCALFSIIPGFKLVLGTERESPSPPIPNPSPLPACFILASLSRLVGGEGKRGASEWKRKEEDDFSLLVLAGLTVHQYIP